MPCSQAASVEPSSCTIRWAACQSPAASRSRARRRRRRKRKKVEAGRPNVFVLDFKGDLFATAVRNLREEVTAITAVAGKGDEVVVRLESAGGAVPHYGLAAAQLMRVRDKSIKLTV